MTAVDAQLVSGKGIPVHQAEANRRVLQLRGYLKQVGCVHLPAAAIPLPLMKLLSSLDKAIVRRQRKLAGNVPAKTVDEVVACIEALNSQNMQLRQSLKGCRIVIARLDVRAKLLVGGQNLVLELRSRFHPDVARRPVQPDAQPD